MDALWSFFFSHFTWNGKLSKRLYLFCWILELACYWQTDFNVLHLNIFKEKMFYLKRIFFELLNLFLVPWVVNLKYVGVLGDWISDGVYWFKWSFAGIFNINRFNFYLRFLDFREFLWWYCSEELKGNVHGIICELIYFEWLF